jgi:hypothetical protein
MIKIPHHSRWLSGIAVFPAIGALLLVSDAALGIDTRYRDYGPVVQDGPTLDMSMLVTNAKIEEQYEAEALIAQLHTPVVDQERMTDVASATLLPSWAGPEREDTDFGLAVSDDRAWLHSRSNAPRPAVICSSRSPRPPPRRGDRSMPISLRWSRPCSATAGRPTSCAKRSSARGRRSARR